ncbi:MAG TPA: O-antigen ligase family protein [Bryobacteraceae bacterium]|jgi:O-antigen ligase|nr:O-antigen ligase family protein [Bryobacteraceae bacterium]
MTHTECVAPSRENVAVAKPGARADRILYGLAFGAAASILFSIAVSQILLGVSIVALLISRRRLRFPPIGLPLALFFAATVIADWLSGDPLKGVPQIRKFFVFGIVLVLFNTFSSVAQIRHLVWAWTGIATVSAGLALVQFGRRWEEAVQLHASIYDYVLDGRITGFASHWMTYGGQQMIVLLLLLALLLCAPGGLWKMFGWAAAAIIWIAIVLGLTRSIFLVAFPAGLLFLAWNYKRWLVWASPAVALVMFLAAPPQIQDRVFSVIRPHGDVDSNSRRMIMARTGLRMIEAHPVFGIGPEQIQPQFLKYLPADVPLPLPKGWYGHLHNVYLQYAAERGLPALAFILWIIGRMATDLWKALRASPQRADARFIWLGGLAVTAAVLAEGFFEYNLGDSEVLTMFLATLTCGYIAIRSQDESVAPQ